ncbi:MAG: hypothetical protein IPI43_11405 [Sandaracinaceae bacterium]|jgi:hypothetical protein|nr:hypothetical protein [Sandaracinaceae bacterium]
MDQVDIAEFLKVGLGVLVATRSEQLVPHCVSGAALSLTGPEHAVVFLPQYEAAPAIANVSANGAIAVVIEQPTTHRGIQLKGRATAVRDTTPGEEAEIAAFVGRTLAEYAMIGLAPAVIARMVFTPCKAVEFTFTDVFEQTPGPGAGRAVTVRR